MKYIVILFLLFNSIYTSEPLDHENLFFQFISLRNQIVEQDRVIQHELPIHHEVLKSLLNENDQAPEILDAIQKEIKRFIRIINLRARRNPRYRELRTILNITPNMENSLHLGNRTLRRENAFFIPNHSPTRRDRSQDSDATVLLSPPNVAEVSSSRLLSSSRGSSLSQD